MGTKVTKYKKGGDGKIRRVPSAPKEAGKNGSPGNKPGEGNKNPPGNPADSKGA